MVVLALVQLLLRWIFSTGISWADIHLRYLVLMLTMGGGVLATAKSRHIRIDLVEHYLKPKTRDAVQRVVMLFSAIATFYLSYVALRFVHIERESETLLKNIFFGISVPIWIPESVIVIAFLLMGVLFILKAIQIPDSSSGETSP